jgi:hypothetical protein
MKPASFSIQETCLNSFIIQNMDAATIRGQITDGKFELWTAISNAL